MPHFIQFFGILINAAEFALIYVQKAKDGDGCFLSLRTTTGEFMNAPLPVAYEKAQAEWIAMLGAPPARVEAHTHENGLTHTH